MASTGTAEPVQGPEDTCRAKGLSRRLALEPRGHLRKETEGKNSPNRDLNFNLTKHLFQSDCFNPEETKISLISKVVFLTLRCPPGRIKAWEKYIVKSDGIGFVCCVCGEINFDSAYIVSYLRAKTVEVSGETAYCNSSFQISCETQPLCVSGSQSVK